MSGHHIQLGTLELGLTSGVPSSSDSWTPLDEVFLRSDIFTPESSEQVSTLLHALGDPGLSLRASWRMRGISLVVRVSLLPSDAPGSIWRRVRDRKGERCKILRKLFFHLRRGWDTGQGGYLMAANSVEDQRMAELYASLPSPEQPDFEASFWTADNEAKRRLMDLEEPQGIKTRLYQYQFRSVAKMLQMETQPKRLVDPIFTPLHEEGRDGVYYVNLTTWDIQRHPGWYDLPRGGILCEQMGTGKTLMCISLITSTLHQPCTPPRNSIDTSDVVTDHAMRTYPFDRYGQLREQVGETLHPAGPGIPSLVDMCADIAVKSDQSYRRSPLPTHIDEILSRQSCFYTFPAYDDAMREAKRKTLSRSIRKTYLANTTLVVVPGILVQQWKDELAKHVEDGVLKMYEVGTEALPDIEFLMCHDIILLDVARFGQEETMHRIQQDWEPSVLLQARWKRIILDEGHVAGSKTSNAMRLAITLDVERRWLVSGTPTKHLQQGGEVEASSSTGLSSRSSTTSRAWSRRDLEDATRIGVMVGGFLAAEPFRSEATFQEKVTNLLRGRDGPKYGAVRRLRYIMGNIMVKHAPRVIDHEALLPPTTLSTQMLQFHPMQRITYNVLASLIASNVHTSNFEDQDYFLHPRNTEAFNQVIKNLHLACFWYSAHDMGAHDCLERTKHHLENNESITAQGRQALQEAVRHLEAALHTPGWEEWMTNGVSIPYEAGDFTEYIRQSWSDSMDSNPDAIDGKSLQLLRDLNRNGVEEHQLHVEGWVARADKCQDFFKIMELEEKRGQREAEHFASAKAAAAQKPLAATKRKGPNKKEQLKLQLEQAKMNAERAAKPDLSHLPRPLPHVIKTKSRSSKVNHVVESILASDLTDKFVIFGDTYELGHLTEALDLFDIRSVFAGHSVSSTKRVEALRNFEKPNVQVCLLDLKLGARGLNLVCANRMIFLSPVWSLDVQAQAIKRIHRIGQKRATWIEILVTEGTFEEEIAKRSSTARSEQEEKLYSRAMIENPRFVEISPCAQNDKLFTVRFIPNGEDEQTTTTAPERDLDPANDLDSPIEVSPTTPIHRRTDSDIEPVIVLQSPTASSVARDYIPIPTASILKRKADQPTSKPKRVRVAFA
ncbi:P-loop containing nucleoside triphosphate hydrolase protein [Naematelia encephala]|uniref:p-loop containing nucleoside triphosphate hydrolase protein n=1 Tax=Naematelia encephala TaxID=71784 RepID=A0A1Y2BL54_9TREE|nr:P-loop containing nucleoside triphosphate hydrolase protein [Naematelia encephala]